MSTRWEENYLNKNIKNVYSRAKCICTILLVSKVTSQPWTPESMPTNRQTTNRLQAEYDMTLWYILYWQRTPTLAQPGAWRTYLELGQMVHSFTFQLLLEDYLCVTINQTSRAGYLSAKSIKNFVYLEPHIFSLSFK